MAPTNSSERGKLDGGRVFQDDSELGWWVGGVGPAIEV